MFIERDNDRESVENPHHDIQDSRCDIAQGALVTLALTIINVDHLIIRNELERPLMSLWGFDNERHGIRGMCSVRGSSIRIEHLLGIAVVCRDKENVA